VSDREDAAGDGAVSFDFGGRVVLVTGGTSGIGRGIAEGFRRSGAQVIITGTRAREDYEDDFAGLEQRRFRVEDPQGAAELAASIPRLDVLVNNAGTMHRDPSELEPAGFEATIAINLTGTFRVLHAFGPHLAASSGSVINIASVTAYFGSPRVPGYSASKGAIVQLTRSLAIAWAEAGVRVNAIAPGWIESNMTAGHVADPIRSRQILDRTPMGRWGAPADVAGPALFLASDAARFVTGAVLNVDGGYTAM
jgi:NAD(P)-dependent dehydrogenase (short-subunit alcohol dehydrogenase family)